MGTERLPVPKLLMQTIWWLPNTCLPSGGLEAWYVPGRGACVARLLCKPWVPQVFHSLPMSNASNMWACSLLQESKASCVIGAGKAPWELSVVVPYYTPFPAPTLFLRPVWTVQIILGTSRYSKSSESLLSNFLDPRWPWEPQTCSPISSLFGTSRMPSTSLGVLHLSVSKTKFPACGPVFSRGKEGTW